MSSAVITPAPTNFAEFEAAGGKMPPAPAPEPVEKQQEPKESSGAAETAAETEAVPEPAQQITQEKPAEPQKGAEKRTLSSEREKLLAEVTELRRQRRELQEQTRTAPEAQPAKEAPKTEDKAPVRPKLADFEKVDDYEEAIAKYEDARDEWRERRAAAKAAEERAQQQQAQIREAYKEKLIQHLEKHPNYDEEIDQTPMSE